MAGIVRTPLRAEGGLTEGERSRMAAHADLWIERIMRTDPIDPAVIVPAIKGLYGVAGLGEPRVVVVPSPLVAYLAGGLAAAWWYVTERGDADATPAATDAATDAATYDATRAATYAATRDATYDATYAATYDATLVATYDATDAATRAATDGYRWLLPLVQAILPGYERLAIECIRNAHRMYQGGNMWGQYDAYLTAARDILGLRLPEHEKYRWWEEAAIHGGWRIMHPRFCMVSDFPEVLLKDEQNRPHCEMGPSHRWRDGFEIYHLDGVRLTRELHARITSGKMTAAEVIQIDDVDVRALALSRLGATELHHHLGGELVHTGIRGTRLYCVADFEGTGEREWYTLKTDPSTGREFVEFVPPGVGECRDADQCEAWLYDVPVELYLSVERHG